MSKTSTKLSPGSNLASVLGTPKMPYVIRGLANVSCPPCVGATQSTATNAIVVHIGAVTSLCRDHGWNTAVRERNGAPTETGNDAGSSYRRNSALNGKVYPPSSLDRRL